LFTTFPFYQRMYIDAEGGVDGLVAHAEAQDHPTPVASAMRLAALAQT
jgi:hypothetical protein